MSPREWERRVNERRRDNSAIGRTCNIIGPAAGAHAGRLAAMLDAASAGKAYGGACNRAACGAPDATWWNPSTRAYYCARCAKRINDHNPGLLFPGRNIPDEDAPDERRPEA